MSEPYRALAAALAPDGIRCQFQTPGQLVISRQVGPPWPDRGNSFWVTHAAGRWYLFTWVPIGYRLTDDAVIADVCRACMAFGKSAMAKVPRRIAREFGLVELSAEEAEAVYQEMDKPA